MRLLNFTNVFGEILEVLVQDFEVINLSQTGFCDRVWRGPGGLRAVPEVLLEAAQVEYRSQRSLERVIRRPLRPLRNL